MRQFLSSLSTAEPQTRLAYRVVRPGRDPSLRGVWWPRSHDLPTELTALIGALESRGFVAGWVSFGRGSHTAVTPRLRIAGRTVQLGRFQPIDPDLVSLGGHDSRSRVDLFVVPPGSHPAMASHAFASVLDWDRPATRGARRAAVPR